jgi:hypothetical protein
MARRTDAEIMKDLRNVECKLSPENLSWDGERPIADQRRAEKELLAMRAVLVKELGREPTDHEIWGF